MFLFAASGRTGTEKANQNTGKRGILGGKHMDLGILVGIDPPYVSSLSLLLLQISALPRQC